VMHVRKTIGTVMVAFLVLASSLPAMCSQCQFVSTKSNCHTNRIQGPASMNTAPEEMASEHCQHFGQHVSHHVGQNLAIFQPGPTTYLASASFCQDWPCQGLLDASAKMNRAKSSRFPQTMRSAAMAEGSGDHEFASQEALQSPIGPPPLTPPAKQPLLVSLRI